MATIDPSARVAEGANIGDGASIGPFCVIGPDVTIGAGCELVAHVYVGGVTSIGARTKVFPSASIGTDPQDIKYGGERTRVAIGEDCVIRESATINTGTKGGGGITRIGNRCMIMAYCHIAHDCQVGDNVAMANLATLAGHCEVGDFAYLGGLCAATPRVRIGAQTMIGASTLLRGDVIPYGMVNNQGRLQGLNVIGMRRRGFAKERIHAARAFYRALFFGEGQFRDRLDALEAEAPAEPAVREMLAFVRAGGARPLLKPMSDNGMGDDEVADDS
jgi:UDP-N-acetylglucosamine acyltransferase